MPGLRHDEQFDAAGRAHVDELPDIRFAGGDHAIEWRNQSLESLLRRQTIHVGLGRLDLRDVSIRGELALINILFRHGIGIGKRLPTLGAHFREFGVGLGGGQGRTRLRQLLVNVGGIDFSEQIAGFDLAANVVLPTLQISGNAGRISAPE